MQDNWAHIEKRIAEHHRVPDNILGCEECLCVLKNLGNRWIPGISCSADDQLRDYEECLAGVERNLADYMRLEKEKLLPVLIRYAEAIVAHALLSDYQEMLRYTADLKKEVKELASGSSSREELLPRQTRLRGKLEHVHQLVEEHARKQEMFFELAREVVRK